MNLFLPCVVGLPFVAAAVAVPLCRAASRSAGWWLSIAPASVFVMLIVALQSRTPLESHALSWIWIPGLDAEFSLRLDALSVSFALLISGIGTLVVVYANAYMRESTRKGFFFSMLLAFMGAMLGIVVAGDLITMYLFWELTSVTSFLLIGFNHEHPTVRFNALQALFVTTAGGLAMFVGFLLLGHAAGTYSIEGLLQSGDLVRNHALYGPIFALILLGACTKSAQFPFHFWLPNAMDAPTPVSAYLHSSTMVKAGVFLLARLHPVLGSTDAWTFWVTAIGTVTAIVGAAMAIRHTVMKPMLAYTTVSTLGLLVGCLGVGTPTAIKAMMAYLFVHAFYKAGLFLVAGALDHETGQKDAEKLAGLGRLMPLTAAGAALAAWSMAGLPPVLGFVGKELVYEAMVERWADPQSRVAGGLVLAGFVFANVVNVLVALQIAWRPFWSRRPAPQPHPHEGPLALWIGALTLGVSGTAFGIVAGPLGHALVGPATSIVLGEPFEATLKLWHGITPALALSAVTLALGVALYALRTPLRTAIVPLTAAGRVGPEAAYRYTVESLQQVAAWQTRVLQNGYLRIYLMTMVVFMLALPGSVVFLRAGDMQIRSQVPLDYLGGALCLAIMAASLAITLTQSRMVAISGLGLVGSGVSVVYVLYSAPDLAMTQFIVEILTVMLFLLVIRGLPPFRPFSSRRKQLVDAVVAAASGIFITLLVISAQSIEMAPRISSYYLQHTVPLAHGRNIVNTILVDFRAMDTLGEILVIALAAIGALALLKYRPTRKAE